MMKALVTSADGPLGLRIATVPDPRPGRTEALVEVRAVGVNRADLLLARRQPAGAGLGLDVAGAVVRAAADGSGPPVGTRIAGLADRAGWAELVAIPTDRLAPLPPEVPDPTGAALPVAGLTALYSLRRAGLLLGRSVLVTGASGGVGGVVVQLAAVSGADVVGWVGSVERGRELIDLGHRIVAGYDTPPAGEIDVVVDSVGGTVFRDAFVRLRRGGVAIVFGNTVRADLVLPPDWGHARAGVRLEHLFLLDELNRYCPDEDLALLVRLVAHGRLRPQIGLQVDWTDVVPAVEALLDRKVNGKVVLTL